jgi:hypothetical protein
MTTAPTATVNATTSPVSNHTWLIPDFDVRGGFSAMSAVVGAALGALPARRGLVLSWRDGGADRALMDAALAWGVVLAPPALLTAEFAFGCGIAPPETAPAGAADALGAAGNVGVAVRLAADARSRCQAPVDVAGATDVGGVLPTVGVVTATVGDGVVRAGASAFALVCSDAIDAIFGASAACSSRRIAGMIASIGPVCSDSDSELSAQVVPDSVGS